MLSLTKNQQAAANKIHDVVKMINAIHFSLMEVSYTPGAQNPEGPFKVEILSKETASGRVSIVFTEYYEYTPKIEIPADAYSITASKGYADEINHCASVSKLLNSLYIKHKQMLNII